MNPKGANSSMILGSTLGSAWSPLMETTICAGILFHGAPRPVDTHQPISRKAEYTQRNQLTLDKGLACILETPKGCQLLYSYVGFK